MDRRPAVARSALYPAPAAAMSGTDREEIYFGARSYPQTEQSFHLAHGDLATALGATQVTQIQVGPMDNVPAEAGGGVHVCDVAGVLSGLSVICAVFDRLGGAPAEEEMQRTFLGSLRLTAQFERAPSGRDVRAGIERSYVPRRRINGSFGWVRQLGAGVMLEFGAPRTRMLEWQLPLRLILIARVALFEYGLRLPGFGLRRGRKRRKVCFTCLRTGGASDNASLPGEFRSRGRRRAMRRRTAEVGGRVRPR